MQFYAYYWGKFELKEISESDGHFFFAEATSLSLVRQLSYKDNQVFLHMGQNTPLLLTDDVQTFFQNATTYGQAHIFDSRPSYDELFTSEQMYVSDFNDPEDFEEVEAYLTLIKGIDTHFKNLLGIKEILGKEEGDKKILQLKLKESTHTIILHKALFDMEAINALNDILAKQFQLKETLHLSIDSKMRMVILKLGNEALANASRMGLLV